MMTPLLNDFGYLANEEFAQQVIDGIYEIPVGMNEFVTDFIKSLKMPDLIRNRKQVSVIFTTNKNKEGWKKMKEYITSAYGTIGFNHYIACSQAEDLNDIDTFLSNTPFKMEIPPEEHQTITDL